MNNSLKTFNRGISEFTALEDQVNNPPDYILLDETELRWKWSLSGDCINLATSKMARMLFTFIREDLSAEMRRRHLITNVEYEFTEMDDNMKTIDNTVAYNKMVGIAIGFLFAGIIVFGVGVIYDVGNIMRGTGLCLIGVSAFLGGMATGLES